MLARFGLPRRTYGTSAWVSDFLWEHDTATVRSFFGLAKSIKAEIEYSKLRTFGYINSRNFYFYSTFFGTNFLSRNNVVSICAFGVLRAPRNLSFLPRLGLC